MARSNSIVTLVGTIIIATQSGIKHEKFKRDVSENLIKFKSWDEMSENYKLKQFGFDGSETWYNILPIKQIGENVDKLQSLIKFFKDNGEDLSLPAPTENSLESLSNYLCYVHENGSVYRCDWKAFAISWKKISILFDEDESLVSLAYIYATCMLYNRSRHLNIGSKFCPNPCDQIDKQGNDNNPCKTKRNTISSRCEIVNRDMMLFRNNYKCYCKSLYEWDPILLECKLKDICNYYDNQNKICGGYGRSEKCEMISNQYERVQNGFHEYSIKCKCLSEYMGEYCEEIRNPCIENYNTELPPGYVACGVVDKRGKCIPTNGTNYYICECNPDYQDNLLKLHPDCDDPVDPCTKVLCVNGFCKTSVDRSKTVCICDDGFEGLTCQNRSAQWLQWKPWSQCTPKCGFNRKRIRKRYCSAFENEKSSAKCYQIGFLDDSETIFCSYRPCFNFGYFLNWSPWTICTLDCDNKYIYRKRNCTHRQLDDKNLIKIDCTGERIQFKRCQKGFRCDRIANLILTIWIIILLFIILTILIYTKKIKNLINYTDYVTNKYKQIELGREEAIKDERNHIIFIKKQKKKINR